MSIRWILLASLFAFFPLSAFADISAIGPRSFIAKPIPQGAIWIAPHGSDQSGNGTEARPFYTPARASEVGRLVVAAPGRYTQFGTITRGGTALDPLVIRAASGTVIFALQDARVPAELSASHIRLEGLEIQNEELITPGICLRIGADIVDIEILHSRLHHCAQAIDTQAFIWSHALIQDVTISDIQQIGIRCAGTCLHHRWNRVLIQHVGDEATTGTALFVSDASRDLRIRDLMVRDVLGDGAVFLVPTPSVANAAFNQISGTSLILKNGGYLGHTQIETEHQGLVASVGTGLTIEKSLFYAQQPTAIPFAISADDQSATTSTLALNFNRIDIPRHQLVLGGVQSHHTVTWKGLVLWFRDGADTIQLPGGSVVTQDQAAQTPAVQQDKTSLFYTSGPIEGDLFPAIFSGGKTVQNSDGSRTITAGTQIRGSQHDLPSVLGQEQYVHLLTSPKQADRWYPYTTEITTIGTEAFATLPRGSDVTEPPGTLIKARSRAQVYVVVAPNKIRWIMNEALAEAYAGPRWNQHILELSDTDLTHYQEDTPLKTEEDFQDPAVLRQVPDPADLFAV